MRLFIPANPISRLSLAENATAMPAKPARRGTTAMEYLLMLSLIVVVALTGIGYFGSMTANLTKATSSAITNSVKKGS